MLVQPPLRNLVDMRTEPDTKGGLPVKCSNLAASFRGSTSILILIVPNKRLKFGTLLRTVLGLYHALAT